MTDTQIDTVRTYFQAVDDGDFETVAAQFTDDCRYVHGPRGADLRGRDAVYEFFDNRGDRDAVHRILRVAGLGNDALGLLCTYDPGPDADPEERDSDYISFASFEGTKIAYYATGYLRDA